MSAEERSTGPVVWRDIPGYEGAYEASSTGRVRNARTGRLFKATSTKKGYKRVCLHNASGQRTFFVHHLVAYAFLPPRPTGYECRHLDGNPENNSATNLQWGTTSENQLDSVRHGTHAWARKTHCPSGHAYTPDNTSINPSGSRRCRACMRNKARTYRATRKRAA